MDPDATLKRIRELSALILAGNGKDSDAYNLAEAIDDLHVWIVKGGFLPTDWKGE